MTQSQHNIKKYANGRLYDATDKKYVTMDDIEEFIKSGVEFTVIVSKTDEDITEEIAAKFKMEKGRQQKTKTKSKAKTSPPEKTEGDPTPETDQADSEEEDREEDASILGRILRMGGGAFASYTRKSADFWQGAFTMAEGEFDKRIKQLVRGKEISETEAKRLKDEMTGFTKNLKTWLGDNLEDRINDMMSAMNLATRDQLEELSSKIEELNRKLSDLEQMDKDDDDSDSVDKDDTVEVKEDSDVMDKDDTLAVEEESSEKEMPAARKEPEVDVTAGSEEGSETNTSEKPAES